MGRLESLDHVQGATPLAGYAGNRVNYSLRIVVAAWLESGVFVPDGMGGTWSLPVIPRRLRVATGKYAFHVLNRAAGRIGAFGTQRAFEAFEEVIGEARDRIRMGAWNVV